MDMVIIGLLMGIVFGWALEKSRVFEPGMMLGQMQLSNFLMLRVFFTAVATGAVVLAVLYGFGFVNLHPKPLYYGAILVGGLMLGAGIVIAGACPGTALAQIGAGYRDAWFTVAGGIAGAMAYGYAEPAIKAALQSGGPGKITFADLTGISFSVLALALAGVLVVALFAMESWRSWKRELGANFDGYFPEGSEPWSKAKSHTGRAVAAE